MSLDKKARADAIIERYRSGETLAQIAPVFAISRERVRQILKELGIDPMTGGAAIQRFLSVDKKVAALKILDSKREERARRFWDMSAADHAQIRMEHGYKPFAAYIEQRRNARSRGVAWEMSFREWWECWQESGKWSERGRGFGYCMARHGDSGPYSKANVYICTGAENFADYRSSLGKQQEMQSST